MLNETEYLLVCLAEECSEIAKNASKGIRFGLSDFEPGQHESNTRRIERELADLLAVAERLGFRIRDEDKAAKNLKLDKYMEYSRQLGTLGLKHKGKCQTRIGDGTVCYVDLPCPKHG